MRASVRRERVIPAPADDVWGLVGAADRLHEWFPGIDACRIEGDVRTITTGTGLELAENLLTSDPLQRRFQYRIEGGFFREHLGTIDVIALDPASCLVVYSSDCDPATMAIVLGGATQGALDELARIFADGGPAPGAADGPAAADAPAAADDRTPADPTAADGPIAPDPEAEEAV